MITHLILHRLTNERITFYKWKQTKTSKNERLHNTTIILFSWFRSYTLNWQNTKTFHFRVSSMMIRFWDISYSSTTMSFLLILRLTFFDITINEWQKWFELKLHSFVEYETTQTISFHFTSYRMVFKREWDFLL